jgi:hypothetical protein
MTLSGVVDEMRAAGVRPALLPRVRAGSWVYGTLSTWMGAADKNAGWDLLCDAKLAFDAAVASRRLSAAELERAREQLAACEVPTGSGGSATTTRRRRCAISTSCSDTSSPACTVRCT